MFSDDELRGQGFTPWDAASEVDAAVVQADHAQYATLATADLPGVTVIVDGRGIIDATNFPGIPVRHIGRPEGSAQDPGSSIAPRS
jgi:UDP-N-acetyl-D-mannosaminuronic acid dehydrogenase